jgi:hypothetical protein
MLEMLKQGYARLLDTRVERLATPGLHFAVTPNRDQPEWANWVHPIWFFKVNNSVICSVSPEHATKTQQIMTGVVIDTLLDAELLTRVYSITAGQSVIDLAWVQCELLYYPHSNPPDLVSDYAVESLQPLDERSRYFLRNFDGGGYGICGADGTMATHACIKNKGLLQEIAVGTEPAHSDVAWAKPSLRRRLRRFFSKVKYRSIGRTHYRILALTC